jgi:streptogramin lyase
MFGIRFTLDWSRRNRRPKSKPARCRPVLLELERRLLPSTINEFALPPSLTHDLDAQAHIAAGADGNLWFSDPVIGIGRVTLQGSVTEFPDFFANTALTAGPDGSIWYGTPGGQLGRITPDGSITHFPIPDPLSFDVHFVRDITAGPDGNTWYVDTPYLDNPHIARITPDAQTTQFTLPPDPISVENRLPQGITAGPDGNLYFTEREFAGEFVGRITPDGQITLTNIPGGPSIITGPDGNIWTGTSRFDDQGNLNIFFEKITQDGAVTEFQLPSGDFVTDLTAGPDGNIWFTEARANQIGMITPDGQVTEYALPTPNSTPAGITAGPDGNIWFTELGSRQIGEFVLNDGGSGAAAAPAKSAPLAQAVHSAAVDSVFGDTRPDRLTPSAANQRASATTVDAVLAASRPEAVTESTGPERVEASSLSHLHQGHQAGTGDVAGLADPLTAYA